MCKLYHPTGPTSAYNCANDMSSEFEGCVENSGIEMCFCDGDFCNRPSTGYSIFASNNKDRDVINRSSDYTDFAGDELPQSQSNTILSDQQLDNEAHSHSDIPLAEHHTDMEDFPAVYRAEIDIIVPLNPRDDLAGSRSRENNSASHPINQASVGVIGTLKDLPDNQHSSAHAAIRTAYIPSVFGFVVLKLISCLELQWV